MLLPVRLWTYTCQYVHINTELCFHNLMSVVFFSSFFLTIKNKNLIYIYIFISIYIYILVIFGRGGKYTISFWKYERYQKYDVFLYFSNIFSFLLGMSYIIHDLIKYELGEHLLKFFWNFLLYEKHLIKYIYIYIKRSQKKKFQTPCWSVGWSIRGFKKNVL